MWHFFCVWVGNRKKIYGFTHNINKQLRIQLKKEESIHFTWYFWSRTVFAWLFSSNGNRCTWHPYLSTSNKKEKWTWIIFWFNWQWVIDKRKFHCDSEFIFLTNDIKEIKKFCNKLNWSVWRKKLPIFFHKSTRKINQTT